MVLSRAIANNIYTICGTPSLERRYPASRNGGFTAQEYSRSYKTLALEADTIDEFTFVWFTDGKGWKSARNNLEETCDVLQHVYNIQDLEDGIMERIFI